MHVRQDLDRALESGAAAGELLDRAFARLGAPDCHLLTGSGRTVARTGGADPLPARRAVEILREGRGTTVRVGSGDAVFDAWYLHLPEGSRVPSGDLEEISGLLGRYRRRVDRDLAARTSVAARLLEAVGAPRADPGRLGAALESCGLAGRAAYTVVTAAPETRGGRGEDGTAALTEALGHVPSVVFAAARGVDGEATAVLAHEECAAGAVAERLREVWPLIRNCCPESVWRIGLSAPVATPAELNAALKQARYSLAAAHAAAAAPPAVAGPRESGGVALLLAGVPAEVRSVYRETVLGPLLKAGAKPGGVLLETLELFLAHDCSWARTAQALHVHVNTVHYRVRRIEILTGRDLSRLDHRLDLRAALLC